ncbi:MAG: ChaN family lipoprotein, partial [Bacteroidota bacterium]
GHGHGMNMDPSNFIAAQASKDATMADRILRHWQPGKCFLHLNGAYHSDQKEGIVWHIQQRKADLEIFTISVVRQASLDELEKEHLGRADVVICVPEGMTTTYR